MKGPHGRDLFADCLGELVMESQEFESILGCIQSNGSRKPGAVDKFQTDTSSVIRLVAEGAEGRGLYEDAVRLYDLAQVWGLTVPTSPRPHVPMYSIQWLLPYKSYFSRDIIFADSEPSTKIKIREKVVSVVNVNKVGVARSLSAKYKTANMHWLFNREICIPRKIGPIRYFV